ncbi:hypothetical protein ARMGADRAFT_1087287 [Armillaria gallica]|uniref:Translation initiation factor eIF2B subunit gamma n=1 Tax=Armillaria gallica TaxID=47427 RepID=A0A2H3CW81_ARMGA|nr:hypothetical protein ARMGADRAFT_1087287 [Armillaria gallica]
MDLDISISPLITREFTVVVLAVFGVELMPLTSDYGNEPCPKALLPVVNKPVVDYVFAWLELSGIKRTQPDFVSHFSDNSRAVIQYSSLRDKDGLYWAAHSL